MMNCFIDNHENKKTILLYEEYDYYQHDDVSNLLLMTALSNIGDIDYEEFNGQHNYVSNLLLMTAYSNIGDINNVVNI